jgi:DNA-binding transcriptional ArsR family regulator
MSTSAASPPALDAAARRFAALGDPTRLAVFRLVSRQPLSVAEVAQRLPVSRPAVSQHLRVLADAGLVSHEVQGNRHLYRPDTDGVAGLRDFIDSLWDVALARFKAEAEALARAAARPARAASPHIPQRKDRR